MNWIYKMRKRALAALFAGIFFFGLPAAAEWDISVPTLGTHPLPYNYLGTFQCIVTNHGDYGIETNVTVLNHATETAVASATLWVPARGEATLAHQSFTGTLENHSCWATLGNSNGFNTTVPNCNEQVIYAPRILGGPIPYIMLQSRINNFTNDPPREIGVVRLTKIATCEE